MGGEVSQFDKEKFPPRNAHFKRHSPVYTRPRKEWGEWCDSLGFDYHTDPDGHPYWFDDSVVFFSRKQINELQEATYELHHLCLETIEKIIDDDEAIMKLGIPKYGVPLIKWSWKRKNIDQQSLYGRFDLMYEGTTPPIFLEYNADTPTTLIESALVQRKWLQLALPSTQFKSFLRSFSNRSLEFVKRGNRKTVTEEEKEKKEKEKEKEDKGKEKEDDKGKEKEEEKGKEKEEEKKEKRSAMHPTLPQCNVIELRLVEQWGKLGLNKEIPIHFTCMRDTIEDLQTITYMATCAQQAGFSTMILYVDEISYEEEEKIFLDQFQHQIHVLWKLYPWECIWDDDFGPPLVNAILENRIRVMEPAWKALLSTKAILPYVYSFFPNHPLIVPAGWSLGEGWEKECDRVIAKPMHGREGENMRIIDMKGGSKEVLFERDGVYEDNKTVYQKALPPVTFPNGRFVVVGGWTVGDECAGVSVREDSIPITTNYSFFLPHYVRD